MRIDDFTKDTTLNNFLILFKHKVLPIQVSVYTTGIYWYCTKGGSATKGYYLRELYNRRIDSVSEEEINLYILKYSEL